MTVRLPPLLTAAGLVAFAATAAQAGPVDWVQRKLGGKPDAPRTGVVKARNGAITVLPDQPIRFPIDDASPEAELPRGRSRFRRIELPKPVENATVTVRVVAQDAPDGRGHTVFKPLFYVLDDEGNVRETVGIDPLKVDIRPFQSTELLGCAQVKNLQRFLVATTEKDVGTSFESGSRSSVSAPTKGGFYYSTDAVKLKLPYAATGELVLTVSPKAPARPCDDKPKA